MIANVGIISKKEYVRGSQAYCNRKLNEMFPTKTTDTYPEPLRVVKV